MVSGWETDFYEAGSLIRTAALGMITAYLRTGRDVVLPQLVSRADELERFRDAAREADADHVCLLLMCEPGDVVHRFRARAAGAGGDPLLRRVREIVEQQGGDAALVTGHAALEALAAEDDTIVPVTSTDPDTTYAALLATLSAAGPQVRSSPSGRPSRRPR